MWLLKSAYLENKNKVNELLRDEYEPFFGFRVTDAGQTKTKMYFRKNEGIELISEVSELQPKTMNFKIDVDRTELDTTLGDIYNVCSAIKEALESYAKFVENKVREELWTPDKNPNDAPDKKLWVPGEDLDAIARNEDKDYLDDGNSNDDLFAIEAEENEDLEVQEEIREAGEPPAGDSFRVVDDIPEEVQAQSQGRMKTEAQEEAISAIRKRRKTNITINPVQRDGSVDVTCGATLYHIDPKGNVEEEKIKANTDSTVVVTGE